MEFESLTRWAPQAYGIWVIVAMIAVYFFREWRETRKLSSTDRQARREGFERQVELLMNENRKLSQDLRELRSEYDNYRRLCMEENEQRLNEIRRLENEVAGLQRRIDTQASSLPRVIEDIRRRDDSSHLKSIPKEPRHER